MAAMNSQSSVSWSSSTLSYIPPHKARMYPFSFPPPPPPISNPTATKSHHHKHLLLIICLSLIPFLLYILSIYRSLHLPSSSSFGLVIEITHSHSQILVFRSLNEVSATPFSGQTSESTWLHPGLSGSDPETLGHGLTKLMQFAKKRVPTSEWEATKVQLLITAQDEHDIVQGVLEECRRVLRSSGFLFRDEWASLLKGEDEGLYNWLAVNYALGYIGNKPQETAGVIEIGKSSMQVSFASNEPTMSNVSREIMLSGVSYHIYTQGFQQFGEDVIWRLLHEQDSQGLSSFAQDTKRTVGNPCIPKGYVQKSYASDRKLLHPHGAGNFSECKYEIMKLLKGRQGKCVHPPCELTLSILNELERKPHPHQRFFLASELHGWVRKASVSDMEAAGRHFCDDDWDTLLGNYSIDTVDLSRSCFSHSLVAALLHNSFGIPLDHNRVEFAVGSTQIDWRFGAFLSQSLVENKVEEEDNQIVRNESITYLLLFAVALVFILLAAFSIMKLRKPQYKTIYDLQKGHYVLTRLPR